MHVLWIIGVAAQSANSDWWRVGRCTFNSRYAAVLWWRRAIAPTVPRASFFGVVTTLAEWIVPPFARVLERPEREQNQRHNTDAENDLRLLVHF